MWLPLWQEDDRAPSLTGSKQGSYRSFQTGTYRILGSQVRVCVSKVSIMAGAKAGCFALGNWGGDFDKNPVFISATTATVIAFTASTITASITVIAAAIITGPVITAIAAANTAASVVSAVTTTTTTTAISATSADLSLRMPCENPAARQHRTSLG